MTAECDVERVDLAHPAAEPSLDDSGHSAGCPRRQAASLQLAKMVRLAPARMFGAGGISGESRVASRQFTVADRAVVFHFEEAVAGAAAGPKML